MSIKSTLITIFVAMLIPVAYAGYEVAYEFYERFFEINAPLIRVIEAPRGVGQAPVRMKIQLVDTGAGLDEVIVRARQRSSAKKVLDQKLGGKMKTTVQLEFQGTDTNLEEGSVEIEIRAFDRSFWSNAAEKVFNLMVDYRPPKIEPISTQHNARVGGSQLVFYKAFDEDLAVSGVKVGEALFEGLPARGLDSDFKDTELYASLYGVELGQSTSQKAKLFAEDRVGNGVSVPFYNRINPLKPISRRSQISEGYLRRTISPLYEQSREFLDQFSGEEGYQTDLSVGSKESLLGRCRLVIEKLKPFNSRQLKSMLTGPNYERFWKQPFLQPIGAVETRFGDNVEYQFEGHRVSTSLEQGYTFRVPPISKEVYASNDGIVKFSDNLGVYGRVLAIDHGFGLTTIYGQLQSINVSKGEQVERGQQIGLAGKSGLGAELGFYYEMRVQGVPVNPIEWWDAAWFNSHILEKISEVKRILGLNVYIPLAN